MFYAVIEHFNARIYTLGRGATRETGWLNAKRILDGRGPKLGLGADQLPLQFNIIDIMRNMGRRIGLAIPPGRFDRAATPTS